MLNCCKIHLSFSTWVHDLQCLTLLCEGQGTRGCGKLKKENSSPKNGLLLMSIGRSYHTRTIICKELCGCTLIFTSLVFNSSGCNCQQSQIVVTCENACPTYSLSEWKMMTLKEVPLYVEKQFCNNYRNWRKGTNCSQQWQLNITSCWFNLGR